MVEGDLPPLPSLVTRQHISYKPAMYLSMGLDILHGVDKKRGRAYSKFMRKASIRVDKFRSCERRKLA